MAVDRRSFAKSLGGVVGAALGGMSRPASTSAQAPASAAAARTAGRLAPAKVTRIRLFYPQNYDRNGPQAFPQEHRRPGRHRGRDHRRRPGGSPDTVRNVARSVIGGNAFDTEIIWQAAFMDGFYSPGNRPVRRGNLNLWDGPVECAQTSERERCENHRVRRLGSDRVSCEAAQAARPLNTAAEGRECIP